MASQSRTSASRNTIWLLASSRFAMSTEWRLSREVTLAPNSTRASTRCGPRNPAPPVTGLSFHARSACGLLKVGA